MRRKGCRILFINDQDQILLFLRDDIPQIPFPNMWDVPGGHVEDHETPEECIYREMKEEMDLDLDEYRPFSVTKFTDRTEHVFWKKANLEIGKIDLTKGQRLLDNPFFLN
jgi:8-oxo-dGTP diphosphatase